MMGTVMVETINSWPITGLHWYIKYIYRASVIRTNFLLVDDEYMDKSTLHTQKIIYPDIHNMECIHTCTCIHKIMYEQ